MDFPPSKIRIHRLHQSHVLHLNRFLFDPCEIDPESILNEEGIPTVTLPREDYRTEHAAKILGLRNGDTLRAGIVIDTEPEYTNGENKGREHFGGCTTDVARIEWLPEGKNKNPFPTKTGEAPGSLKIYLDSLGIPKAVNNSSRTAQETESDSTRFSTEEFQLDTGSRLQQPSPPVSLLLALPRPLALARLLPMISQMGVKDLVLISAQKVPRDYFGSHLFRKPNELRRLLIEGLCQSGDVQIPRIRVIHRLKPYLEDGELDSMFPKESYARVIAHPQRADLNHIPPLRLRDVVFPTTQPCKVVLAVGPEGGWAEPYELDLFQSHGFQQISLGNRILRSDVAVVSMLSLAHDLCESRASLCRKES